MEREGKGLRAQSRRGRIGRTWWSERWTAVLESIGLGDRLHRGRSIARAGSVRTLEVSEGEVTAIVYGARQEVHRVRIAMDPIPPGSWEAVQEILSRQALFAARLLAGEMPHPIEEAFAEAGLSLFPVAASELVSECDCADPARPCPHAAAVFYLLAERFDQDPFQIFLFRGQGQQELLESIKQRWAQSTSANGEESAAAGAVGTGATDSGTGNGTRADAAAEDGAPPAGPDEAPVEAPADLLEGFWDMRADLEPLSPRIMPPPIPEAVVRRLGPPPGAAPDSSAEAALRHAYQIASTWALKLAMKDGGEET